MTTRTPLLVLTGAAVVASLAGCGTSNAPTPTATPPPTSATSAAATSSAAPAQPSPVTPALTRVPCELLTPALAQEFAGFDAERQLQLDSDPPLPVGDNACFYKGGAGSVILAINSVPADPEDPVNHFHVIQPANRIPDLAYEAYWFGAGESVVVVKDGLLLNVKVSGKPGSADDYQAVQKQEIKLADQIVPRVG